MGKGKQSVSQLGVKPASVRQKVSRERAWCAEENAGRESTHARYSIMRGPIKRIDIRPERKDWTTELGKGKGGASQGYIRGRKRGSLWGKEVAVDRFVIRLRLLGAESPLRGYQKKKNPTKTPPHPTTPPKQPKQKKPRKNPTKSWECGEVVLVTKGGSKPGKILRGIRDCLAQPSTKCAGSYLSSKKGEQEVVC